MRAKICGITQIEDALLAAAQGAWAVGFNFYPKSPRYIAPENAHKIIQRLPDSILKVGLVIDTPVSEYENLLDKVGLSLLQVYASVDVSNALKKRMIYCLHANQSSHLPEETVLNQFGYLLLDAPREHDGLLGGTGRLSNWDIARMLSPKYRLILAGGLTPLNVHHAIQQIKPYAVDVASGVQSEPGKLDRALLDDFLTEVRREI